MSEVERKVENSRPDPGATGNDNFGDARMAAPIKVAYNGNFPGLPRCEDIIPTIQTMGADHQHMLRTMDKLTGHSFASQGVTLDELKNLSTRNDFSEAEKRALGVMIDGFKLAPDYDNNKRMNVREFSDLLMAAGAKQQCHFPEMDRQRRPGA